jgi:hypothetical protein
MLQLEQFKAIYSLFIPHSKSPWQQLNSKKNEIRILTLLPAQSSSDDIHCQLQIVFLQDQPEYEALSSFGDIPVTLGTSFSMKRKSL